MGEFKKNKSLNFMSFKLLINGSENTELNHNFVKEKDTKKKDSILWKVTRKKNKVAWEFFQITFSGKNFCEISNFFSSLVITSTKKKIINYRIFFNLI